MAYMPRAQRSPIAAPPVPACGAPPTQSMPDNSQMCAMLASSNTYASNHLASHRDPGSAERYAAGARQVRDLHASARWASPVRTPEVMAEVIRLGAIFAPLRADAAFAAAHRIDELENALAHADLDFALALVRDPPPRPDPPPEDQLGGLDTLLTHPFTAVTYALASVAGGDPAEVLRESPFLEDLFTAGISNMGAEPISVTNHPVRSESAHVAGPRSEPTRQSPPDAVTTAPPGSGGLVRVRSGMGSPPVPSPMPGGAAITTAPPGSGGPLQVRRPTAPVANPEAHWPTTEPPAFQPFQPLQPLASRQQSQLGPLANQFLDRPTPAGMTPWWESTPASTAPALPGLTFGQTEASTGMHPDARVDAVGPQVQIGNTTRVIAPATPTTVLATGGQMDCPSCATRSGGPKGQLLSLSHLSGQDSRPALLDPSGGPATDARPQRMTALEQVAREIHEVIKVTEPATLDVVVWVNEQALAAHVPNGSGPNTGFPADPQALVNSLSTALGTLLRAPTRVEGGRIHVGGPNARVVSPHAIVRPPDALGGTLVTSEGVHVQTQSGFADVLFNAVGQVADPFVSRAARSGPDGASSRKPGDPAEATQVYDHLDSLGFGLPAAAPGSADGGPALVRVLHDSGSPATTHGASLPAEPLYETTTRAGHGARQVSAIQPIDRPHKHLEAATVAGDESQPTLFIDGHASLLDVHQGTIGDCFMWSAVQEMLATDPTHLDEIFQLDGNTAKLTLWAGNRQTTVSADATSLVTFGGDLDGSRFRVKPTAERSDWWAAIDGDRLVHHQREVHQIALWAPLFEQLVERWMGRNRPEDEAVGFGIDVLNHGGLAAAAMRWLYGPRAGSEQIALSGSSVALSDDKLLLAQDAALVDALIRRAHEAPTDARHQMVSLSASNGDPSAGGADGAHDVTGRMDPILDAAIAAYPALPADLQEPDLLAKLQTLKTYRLNLLAARVDASAHPEHAPAVQAAFDVLKGGAARVVGPHWHFKVMTDPRASRPFRDLIDLLSLLSNTDANGGARTAAGAPERLIASHTYSVVGVQIVDASGAAVTDPAHRDAIDTDRSKVHLRNPWGEGVPRSGNATPVSGDAGAFKLTLHGVLTSFTHADLGLTS